MKIVVIGGTGLIASKLVTNLARTVTKPCPRHATRASTPSLADAHIVVEVSNSPSFEDTAMLDDELTRALDALPQQFALAVLLANREGLSFKEIAERLEIRIGTVISRLNRGRRGLGKPLHDTTRRDSRTACSDSDVGARTSAESLVASDDGSHEPRLRHSRVGRAVASAGPRSMVDVTLIARVIDSLERRRGAIAGLPADAAVVAYDELCYAFATTLLREVEGFNYHGFLRATLGIRGGR